MRRRSLWGRARAALTGSVPILILFALSSTLSAEEAKKEDKPHTKKIPEPEPKPVLVEPGAYEIKVSTENADGDAMGETLVETHCLTQMAGVGFHGFAVLDPNSPLRNCPLSNLHETGDALSFDIRCTSGNPARARAYFSVFGAKFRGRIEIAPGNDAAKMAELQDGRRIGSCPVP